MAFDFDAAVTAPFRMQPGLRRIAPEVPQLTPLAPGSRHQREKLAVLSACADEALLCAPGFDAGPALAALATHAAAEHPDAWTWDGARAVAAHLGVAVGAGGALESVRAGTFGLGDEIGRCLAGLEPSWRLAGLLALAFAEDLAIVDGDDGTIPWLAVALPSFWSPREKVGRPFAAVHAPVADNTMLLKAADALVATITAHGRWERFVWTLTPHTRLHAHPDHVDPRRWALAGDGPIAAQAWFRSERQTFVPVPGRRQAVFTIAIDVQPLRQVAADPARARALHAALSSMSPAVLEYRGLAPVRERLLQALADLAAAPP